MESLSAKTHKESLVLTTWLTGGGGVELPAFSFDTLQNFLASQTPLQACYYCYGTSGQEIPAGVQLSKEELNFINTPLTSTDN